MKHLILASGDKRIMFISDTLDYQENGNYLVMNDTIAIPPSICELVEVASVPDGIEPEKWCYKNGEFVPNPDWREPEPEPGDASEAIAEALAILRGDVKEDE